MLEILFQYLLLNLLEFHLEKSLETKHIPLVNIGEGDRDILSLIYDRT
jgi:hypothetical protein